MGDTYPLLRRVKPYSVHPEQYKTLLKRGQPHENRIN